MRAHESEMDANTPLKRAIFEAVKNVMIWKDCGSAIPDWKATNAAREKIERLVRKAFAAKAKN